jgi:hypothetical protein
VTVADSDIPTGSWESRMAERARQRAQERAASEREALPAESRSWDFTAWYRDGDPPDINPQILAARCLGIEYGDPGPRLPEDRCRRCWADRYVWMGNAWGVTPICSRPCGHGCHEGEVWLG